MGMFSITRSEEPRPELRVTLRSRTPGWPHEAQDISDKVDRDDEEIAERAELENCFGLESADCGAADDELTVASLPDRQTVSRKATMRGSLTAHRNRHLTGCRGRSGKRQLRRAGVDRRRGSGGDVRRAGLGALGSVRWTAARSAMQRRSVTCLSHAGPSIALALARSTVTHAAQACPWPHPATHATRPVASRRARGTIATNTGIPTCPDPSA